MLKGAYSEKFKSIRKEQLDNFKEERKEGAKTKTDRAKELSKETNRRRKALEERKKEQQESDEKTRQQVLAKRRQEQQEATQRFQKETVHKTRPGQDQNAGTGVTQQEPTPVVRDGRYVIRGHVVEVRDGKQLPYSTQLDTEGPALQGPVLDVWNNEAPALPNTYTSTGVLYAMNSFRNEGTLYHRELPGDPHVASSSSPDGRQLGSEAGAYDRTEAGLSTDRMTEQEKLRAGAITNSGPKLAFINDVPQHEFPEGVLPCIMGRESPVGSISSLDSLDEVPHEEGSNTGEEVGASAGPSIIAKGRKGTKSATKRRVTFSDSIEFDDGVTGALVTEEKQSTKVYTMLYAKNVNSYYSASSTALTPPPGPGNKGHKSTGLTSGAQKGTLQEATGTANSPIKSPGKEPSTATVSHCDYPRAMPGAPSSKIPAKNTTSVFPSSQWDDGPHRADDSTYRETRLVEEHMLSDSLEVAQDSLDGEASDQELSDSDSDRKQVEVKTEDMDTPWTTPVRPSAIKDSLEIQRAVERTSPEDTDDVFKTEGSQQESELVYSSAGYFTDPYHVTSGSQLYQTANTSAAPIVGSSPYFYQQNSQVYGGVSERGSYHQNFPYPFYTTAGTTLLGTTETSMRQGSQNPSMPPSSQSSATSIHQAGVLGRNVTSSSDYRGVPLQGTDSFTGADSVNTRRSGNSQSSQGTRDASSQSESSSNGTSSMLVAPRKVPSSNASVDTRSTRSLIPRPPSSKKSARGRIHVASHHRKQESGNLHKAMASNSHQAGRNVRTARKDKVRQVRHAVAGQSPDSQRTTYSSEERNFRPKNANRKNHDGDNDDDELIESIKRNMQKINMRTRTTAAEEERHRIVNSLRLEFGDGKDSRPESAAEEFSKEMGTAPEHQATRQDAAGRRVHHPRVGSAGSRSGKGPVTDHTIGDTRSNGNVLLGKNVGHDKAVAKKISHNPSSNPSIEVQNPAIDSRGSKQGYYGERKQAFPISTVAFATSAAAASSPAREGPSSQARAVADYGHENGDLKRSISLDRTPTDDEINHLWAHVRSYLHSSSTQSAGSDSCVDRIDVRRSRTASGSLHPASHQLAAPLQYLHGSPGVNGHLEVGHHQAGGSTLGGLRRYGSHEVLRRHSSSDSISYKRSPLLQQRAVRGRRPPQHVQGQMGKPPLPRQHQYNPAPSQGGPSPSLSGRGPQPLSPAEMQAVMKASEKEMFQRQHHDTFNELLPHQQYHPMINGRKGPSALSIEEQRLLESLDRLNVRLKAQEEITKAISQKPRMADDGLQKTSKSRIGSGSTQTQKNRNASARNFLHTR